METVTDQPHDGRVVEEPVLLVSLGEASVVTQGQGSSEDKRRAYN